MTECPNAETIRHNVEAAHLPSLLAALRCLTGDRRMTGEEFRPKVFGLARSDQGLDPEQRVAAIETATSALTSWFHSGCPAGGPPDEATLRALMEFCGDEVRSDPAGDYLPLLHQELGLSGTDPRAPAWSAEQLAPRRRFRVVIIGAGFSGLAMAYRCLQAKLETVVLEKNRGVGGTWRENTYPGCRVDVPSHLYTYSFAHRDDWPHVYSKQSEIRDYLNETATSLGLLPHIRFNSEVVQAQWDDDRCRWALSVTRDGRTEVIEAEAIVSAVGQLNRPHVPDLHGADSFTGPTFHSAGWDHHVDLTDKRVAVIGTGASAAQIVPEIAAGAKHVSVFQRTPAWFIPGTDYRDPTSPTHEWLCRVVPGYSRWYRFLLFRWYVEGLMPFALVDPEWSGNAQSVSELNDTLRQTLTDSLREATDGDDELFAQLLPDYPVTAKRMIRDDGSWVRTLRRENVDLVTTGIDHITPGGVVTSDGTHHDADVLVWSTGFRAADFLMPMTVTGRQGRDLHRHWDGDARAYLGITIPGFPNLFCLYGPNTNIVLNGSVVWLSECEVDYTMSALETLLRTGHDAMDCRTEVHDSYNARIDDANAATAWGACTVNSWYRNSHGRIAQNWPGNLLEFWRQTRHINTTDYEFLDRTVHDRGADTQDPFLPRSLAAQIRAHGVQRPDHPALHHQDRTFTYRELDERSSRVANALVDSGISPTDRVAVLDKNSIELVEMLFGAAKCGAVLVPINWRLAPPEIAQVIADARAELVVVAAEFAAALDNASLPGVRRLVIIGDHPDSYQSWVAAARGGDPGHDGGPDDVALQLYTSGTTGLPKGVMITNRNLGHLDRIAQSWGYTPASIALTAMPLFHIGGVGSFLLCTLLGGTTVLHREVDPARIATDIPKHRITHVFLVPAVLQVLVSLPAARNMDWSSLQTFLYGAAPISEHLLATALDILRCDFIQAYGLTECTGVAVHLEAKHHDPVGRPDLLRSCGKPLAWVEIKIVDPATGDECPTNRVGELRLRSGQNMAGYWNNLEATAEALTTDGWLRTGDAGYIDDEGFVYIHDRIKDMIVSGAENIYPAEVENVLAHHPSIAEVAILGIPHQRWGETPHAIVVVRPGHQATAEDIITYCRDRLAHYKCPTNVEFTAALPRNPAGKVLKRDLRAPHWASQDRRVN